jgi:uncharacterized delta-60 repeat protein
MKNSRRYTAFCIILALLVISIPQKSTQAAAASMGPDQAFRPVFASPGKIRGILPLEHGKAVVWGDLTTINGAPQSQIAVINANGSVDTSFNLSTEIFTTRIDAAALAPDGKIYIGGLLSWVNSAKGHFQYHMFRLNADGSVDGSFDAGGYDMNASVLYGLDGRVTAIHGDPSGKVLVGGDFQAPYASIARLNSDGSVDNTFNPGSGANGVVTLIARQSGGQIIIGGEFTSVNGTQQNHLARLGSGGTLDSAYFGSGISGDSLCSVSNAFSSLVVGEDDSVYIGGTFSTIKGVARPMLAHLLANGSVDSSFHPNVNGYDIGGYFENIESLALANNVLMVGGWGASVCMNGHPAGHAAKLFLMDKSSGAFQNFRGFAGSPTDLFALAVRSDGLALAGGSFTVTDEPLPSYYGGLFAINPATAVINTGFISMVGGQASVRSIALQGDGKIVAAGSYYRVNGTLRKGMARISPDGSLDASFNPAGGPPVMMAMRSDGKLAFAGAYGQNDLDNTDLLLLDSDGAVLSSGSIGTATSLLFQEDNKLIATIMNPPGIRRLQADLTEDSAFSANVGSGISNSVRPDGLVDWISTAALQDGKILVGGSFTSFSGQIVQNLVRLNADGSFDSTFTSATYSLPGIRSEVNAIVVQPNGKILVAGSFATINGAACNSIIRLEANGAIDPTFPTLTEINASHIYALALQQDGKILVGGDLQVFDGQNIYNNFIRLNEDGARDTAFNANVRGVVYQIIPSGVGVIYLAGSFDQVDGIPFQGLARYIVPSDWENQVMLPVIRR